MDSSERAPWPKGSAYDAKWEAMERAGNAIHGEADLVASFRPRSVLDAGCGTGRVAVELAQRGIDVVGADIDSAMLAAAREKAPRLDWLEVDLASPTFGQALSMASRQTFDAVVAAGNVMIFVDPHSVHRAITNLGATLRPEGLLIAGFQLNTRGLSLGRYDEICSAAGLALRSRWSTWERGPFQADADYAVSVHAKAM